MTVRTLIHLKTSNILIIISIIVAFFIVELTILIPINILSNNNFTLFNNVKMTPF